MGRSAILVALGGGAGAPARAAGRRAAGGGGGAGDGVPPTDVTITVTSAADTTGGRDGCTLRDAIVVANAPDVPVGGCTAVAAQETGGGTTIAFALPGAGPWTITLDSALPRIIVALAVRGPGAARLTIRRDAANADRFRLLESSSDLTIADLTLAGGATDGSGGGFYAPGSATVTGSTLSGNTTSGGTGGGFFVDSSATVEGSTFSGNSATTGGGFSSGNGATVTNSVLAAGASGANCAGGAIADAGGVIASDASCGSGGAGSRADADPRLAPLADNGGPTMTHALGADSPARGAGLAADCAARATDQRGVARPATGCDSGAYQVVPLALAPATLPDGTVGAAYRAHLTAGGGDAPHAFAVTAGALPGGLALAADGALTGTPTAAGTASFTVTATDARGYTGSRAYTVAVGKASQAITFGTPAGAPSYTVGDTFAVGATASSGLPVGFAAGGACTVSGATVTATAAGTCTVTASQAGDATYAAAPDVARSFPIAAASSPSPSPSANPSPSPSPAASPSARFADVPAGHWAYGWVERFVALGLTTGCGTDEQGRRLFCPDRAVTRAETAVFLIRAYP